MNTTGSPKTGQRKGLDFVATIAIRDARLHSTLKLLLFALASRSNPNTHQCHPSQALLEQDTGLNRKTIQRKTGTLERMGLISREEFGRSGYRKSFQYTLNVDVIRKLAPCDSQSQFHATFSPTPCDSQTHEGTVSPSEIEETKGSIASKLAITPSGESPPEVSGKESTQEEEKGGSVWPVQLIASAWIRLLKEQRQPFVDLSQKEVGQLGQFGNKLRAQDIDPEKVLTYVVEHWTPFTRHAQKHHGAFKSALPKEPTTGFLLRFRNAAVQMYLEDMEDQEQTIPSPLPSIEPVPDSGDPKPVAVLPIIPMTTDSSWLEDY